MFLHLSVILSTGGECLGPGGGWGVWLGGCLGPGGGGWSGWGVSRSRPRGEVGGLTGGVSRPRPRGRLGGSGQGCVCPGPHPVGWPRYTPGGCPGPGPGGCIPTCTEADTPKQMATAVGGTHPTGMHSC